MSSQKRCSLQVEGLESRQVLSTLAPADLPTLHRVTAERGRFQPERILHLGGTIHGMYSIRNLIPDAGATHLFSGSGQVRPLGQVDVSASLHATGFLASGRSSGTVILTNSKGSVNLRVVGPVQGGFAPLPSRLSFSIQGGTGRYQGATGFGTLHLELGPRPFCCTGNRGCPGQGSFTLVIQSRMGSV